MKLHPIPFVIVTLVAMFALAGALQTKTIDNSEYATASQKATSYNGKEASPIHKPAIVGLLPPKNGIETRYDPKKTDQYDLQAQRWMAWLTGVIALLTLLGIGLIAATLRETGQILAEAKLTTAAANRTVDETRRIGEAQVRAYVGITKIRAEPLRNSKHIGFISVVFENTGGSPAREIICGLDLKDVESSEDISRDSHWIRGDEHYASDIGSRCIERITTRSNREYREMFDRFDKRKSALAISVFVEYSDIFDRRWRYVALIRAIQRTADNVIRYQDSITDTYDITDEYY